MRKLRVAAVGLGWVALNRHLPVMERSKSFEIVGVVDRTPGHASKIAHECGYPEFAETSALATIDWMRDVDAVTIATAPMNHYDLIKQALELGKHVLTEKPFAMSVPQGEHLVRLADKNNLGLAVVHNFQFARSTKRLLAEISQGTIGAIRAVNAIQFGNPKRRLPTWYDELPLGLFYDESPHLLYLTRLVAGAIELDRCWTFPSSTGTKTPARIDAVFRSPTLDCPISLHCNFESPVSEWYLAVFGEERLGIVDVFRDIYISLPNDGKHDTSAVFRTSRSAIFQHLWQHVVSGIPHLRGTLMYGNEEVFARFYSAVNGNPHDLDPIGPESALAVLRLQHAIIAGHETFSPRKTAMVPA